MVLLIHKLVKKGICSSAHSQPIEKRLYFVYFSHPVAEVLVADCRTRGQRVYHTITVVCSKDWNFNFQELRTEQRYRLITSWSLVSMVTVIKGGWLGSISEQDVRLEPIPTGTVLKQ